MNENNELIKKRKNKTLFCGILTFLPIIIYVIGLFILAAVTIKHKDYGYAKLDLYHLIGIIALTIVYIISFIMNIKLEKKVLRIVFSIISALFLLIGSFGIMSQFKQYEYSKKSDQIVSSFIKNVDNKSSNYITTCNYCNYKTGDIIYDSDIEISTKELDDNNLYCNWYTKIVNIDKNNVKTYAGCWSTSNKHIYYYKSENFNNDLLEK